MDSATRERMRELSRALDAGWWVRDRVEMVLLAAEGWSAPLIAQHLGCSDKTCVGSSPPSAPRGWMLWTESCEDPRRRG
jgi:hypothetical protein